MIQVKEIMQRRRQLLVGSIVLLLGLPVKAAGFGDPGDTLRYKVPVYFTQNDGQWDPQVQYGIRGGRSSAWFLEHGITLIRHVGETDVPLTPSEQPVAKRKRAVLELSFVNPSPHMRIVRGEASPCKSNFYRGSDSGQWYEAVPNYTSIQYENVWDGIDIEYSLGEKGSLRQRITIAPGSDAGRIRIEVIGEGKTEVLKMMKGATEASRLRCISEMTGAGTEVMRMKPKKNSVATVYKDTLNLTSEFNTAFNVTLGITGMVVSPKGSITICGEIDNAGLPVKVAIQDKLRGLSDHYVMQFMPDGQDLRFCSYLGGAGEDKGVLDYHAYHTGQAIALSQDYHIIGVFNATGGAPVTSTSFCADPKLSSAHVEPRTSYVYHLSENGTLYASTYLGGPGDFMATQLQVRNQSVYIMGTNYHDSLRDINAQSAVSKKSHPHSSATCLAKLSVKCDSLNFMTYLYTTNDPQHSFMTYVDEGFGCMAVDDSGRAIVGFGIAGTDERVIVLPGVTREQCHGIWVAKLATEGDRFLFSRTVSPLPGLDQSLSSPDGITDIFPYADNRIAIFGSRTWPKDSVLPSKWSIESIISGNTPELSEYVFWGAMLSDAGELDHGKIFGNLDLLQTYPNPVVRDPVCGGFLMFLWSTRNHDVFHPINEVSNDSDTLMERYCISIDEQLRVRYATKWNSAYYIGNGTPRQTNNIVKKYFLDHNGYAYQYASTQHPYAARRYYRSWRYPLPASPGWPDTNEPYNEEYLTRFRIYTPCWQVGCDLSVPDTIKIERTHTYGTPSQFTVNYTVTNYSSAKPARIDHATIELPPGFELVSGLPSQSMMPTFLGPSITATCSWQVRISDAMVLIDSGAVDTALFRCRVFYVNPQSEQSYPMGEELCEQHIPVVLFDEHFPESVCSIKGPDSLYWMGDGYSDTPAGPAQPIRYLATITNPGPDTLQVSSFRFRAWTHCRITSDSIRPGRYLLPGEPYTDAVEVEVGASRYDRKITIEIAALDSYGVPMIYCTKETFVPGTDDLPCTVSGTDRLTWNTATGTSVPDEAECTLLIENPLDTVRTNILAHADLSSAPHLAPAAGDSLARTPFYIIPGFKRSLTWRFNITSPPAQHAFDTVRFIYEYDGIEYRCNQIVEIVVIDETVTCAIVAPDSLRSEEILTDTPVTLDYTLTNTGTVPVSVDRYVLDIQGGSGVTTADPLTRPGGSVDPGNDVSLLWNLRVLALHDAHTARLTVTAYGANDEILSVCTHEMAIEGVESPICSMSATDTVRFNRAGLRYEPDEITASFTLENLLDTQETNIEARIDLTQAPRFVLDASETASKTVAVIDSHATSNLTWQLIPQRAPRAENQEIVVLYKSEQMTAWQECRVTVFIEAWPEEATVECATGGHDSLYADAHYERFIPDPLHVSYTVTNTGTVALTGCEASIILPPEFALAGADSTQSFTAPAYANEPGGPVPEGTILPNASCTRWWKITPTQAIADTAPKQIRWQWTSDQQGAQSGCERTMYLVPQNPQSIVLTPLHLYFEAERGGALPSEQHVRLWTGGGLVMPWTAQPSEWWLDAQPLSGSQAAQVAVQPNSTMLDVGAHGAEILLAATPENRRVAVTYVIRKSTGIGEPHVAPAAFTLDAWPQPVPSGTRLHVRIGGPSGKACLLTLHDLLGRERISQKVESNPSISIDFGTLYLPPGMYVLRARSDDGAQSVRTVMIVR
ncbi:MAG: hypothetical protein JXA28_13155 [Bacteroidetes bacterium]|nr:hypothetical protein [Bacteroidota bacterium]